MRRLNFIISVFLAAPLTYGAGGESVTVTRTMNGSVVTLKSGEIGTAEKIFKALDQTDAQSLPTRDGKQLTGKTIEAAVVRTPAPVYSVDLKVDTSTSNYEIKQEKGSRIKIALSGGVAQELFEAIGKTTPASPTPLPEEIFYRTPEVTCGTTGAGISPSYSCLVQINPAL